MPTAAVAGLVLGLFVGGAASGLIPLLSAEALLAAATISNPHLWLVFAVTLTVGQCTAKLLIFLAARRGAERLHGPSRPAQPATRLADRVRARMRHRVPAGAVPTGRLQAQRTRLIGMLSSPLAGTAVVATSAATGLPPLAVVSVMAGVARQRSSLFVVACLAGRLVRFVCVAWPVAHLLRSASGQLTGS